MKTKIRLVLMYIGNFFAIGTILFTVSLCAILLISGEEQGLQIVLAYSLSWVPILGLNISMLVLHSKRIRILKGKPSLKEKLAFYKTEEGKKKIMREFGIEETVMKTANISLKAKYVNPETED